MFVSIAQIFGITQGERNYIMQVVCEATQSSASDVQVAAFECLVKIMQLFYDKMQFYMEKALFGVSRLKFIAPTADVMSVVDHHGHETRR